MSRRAFERIKGDTFLARAKEMVENSYYGRWQTREAPSEEFFSNDKD